MKLIIIDLEHNQPSGNIIQIGAVFVDLKRNKVIDKFDKYIQPGEPIAKEITELTGITDDMVRGYMPHVIFFNFWAWVEKCNCGGKLSAWGPDVYHLKEQSLKSGVEPPKKLKNIDIKYMFEIIRSAYGSKQRGGLKKTLELFDFEFEGKQHDAFVDAYNTATLMFYMYNVSRTYFLTERLYKIQKS
jgi:inhibitor of KinA sporulation pathway (predicted exonuclease)